MLLKKADEDKSFKKLLLSDPEKAVKNLGLSIPKGFKLKVIKEEEGEYILVIPNSASKNDALNDTELLKATGGWTIQPGDLTEKNRGDPTWVA